MAARTGSVHLIFSMDLKPSRKGGRKKNRGCVLGRWATRLRKREKNRIKSREMYEGTVWATRLWKRGKKRRKDSRGVCEGTGQATRLRKSGKRGDV